MRPENIFFLSALITFLAIRAEILLTNYFFGERHFYFRGQIIHHFWFGFIILAIGMLISNSYPTLKTIFYGIGFGPIIDELVFMLIGGGGFANYLSIPSWIGAAASTLLLFLFRAKILDIFLG